MTPVNRVAEIEARAYAEARHAALDRPAWAQAIAAQDAECAARSFRRWLALASDDEGIGFTPENCSRIAGIQAYRFAEACCRIASYDSKNLSTKGD